jgi:hypothetical protein
MPYPNYYPVAAPSKVAAHPGWSKVIDEDAIEASGEDRRVKAEARRLEQRVADTASRQSSFEEISSLHREVQQWLDKQSARKSNSEVCFAAAVCALALCRGGLRPDFCTEFADTSP